MTRRFTKSGQAAAPLNAGAHVETASRFEGMAGVFSDKVKKAENKDGEIKELHAKIG